MSFPPPPPPPPPPFAASFFGFEPCCGGATLYFKFDGTTVSPELGINIYDGPAASGYDPLTDSYIPLANQCYKIFRGEATNPASPINGTNYNNLQVIPTNFGTNYTWDSTTTYESVCGDEVITCPPCQPITYDLWPCDETLLPVTTDTDLSVYLEGFASIQVDADGGYDCYYVTLSVDSTNVITVAVDGDTPCNCNCTCYEIIGTAKLRYVDCDGNAQSTLVTGYWKECSLVYPVTSPSPGPNLIVTNNGLCVDGECPGQCYELTDCDGLLDPIYTTAQSLSPNATLGQTVIIQGYSNCWTVTDVVSCNAAIDVVVLQSYSSCDACSPAPNYILTNCDDANTIIYTSSDLSAYVGQVIQRDSIYPGCWIVDLYPNPIPSDVPVTVTSAYDDCEACGATYYVLSDCSEFEPNIVTSTDLSAYVGSIITLEWCPNTCWSVGVSSTSSGAGILGDISSSFETCQDCLTSFPCVCSRIKNHDTVSHDYSYLDCTGYGHTITLLPGQRSERMCITHWLTSYPTDYVEYFGDCIDNTCPPPVYIKRSIKPGYNTPACSAAKYEEITCKSSQALYRNVLTLRYGISNCCPEEDTYWLVKKQLIDLAALYNPDFPCTVSTCGCGCGSEGSCGSSCGCGQAGSCSCNQSRSCNS